MILAQATTGITGMAAFCAAMAPAMPAHACAGLTTSTGECVYKLPLPGEAAMEHEAPREMDGWRKCLAGGEVSTDCPPFVFHRADFQSTDDEIAKQKMSIIVWQTARAAFRCEGDTFDRLSELVAGNFSGVAPDDLARTLPALSDMQAYIEETC
ncbi:hypothetical protein KHP62_05920 [Rhodobacteraceae bacterium NNCM2]|nr:hypothetical protein [Coraliihabitans acroporae]